MTPGETLREFCRTWFVQRDAERTLAFLTEDVGFVGTGTDEMASGRQQMAGYLAQDIREIPEPFECELSPIYEQPVADGIYNMSADLTLKNSKYTWYLRAFFTLVLSGEEWLVKSFHVAEPASSQKDAEHYPGTLVMEHTSRLRQELLNDSLPGGMMGGYIEDGFPFYFINRRMLEYLGYENETEFVSDIGGMITNCMHPDDRNRVDQLVACQLERSEEYVVEYRMRKKDGSFRFLSGPRGPLKSAAILPPTRAALPCFVTGICGIFAWVSKWCFPMGGSGLRSAACVKTTRATI